MVTFQAGSDVLRMSVVIPAFNRADLLAECLDSVMAQSTPAWEVLVVDDASSDGTAAVAARYPVRLLRHAQNQGLASARNTAIAAATGDAVAFLDSDDVWYPDHLTRLTELLHRHPTAGLAFTRTRSFGLRDELRAVVLPPDEPRRCYWELLDACFVPIQAAAVRREVIDRCGAFEPGRRIVEDYEWFLRIAPTTTFVASQDVTVGYRVHGHQLTASPVRMILATWACRLAERRRIAALPDSAAPLQRLDALVRPRLEDAVHDLVYYGEVAGLHTLRDMLEEAGATPLLPALRHAAYWRAQWRAYARRFWRRSAAA
jgi:glycosyltransferase involved in cell wall biosynthesis